VNIFRTREGKVAEIWNHRDDLGLMQQVGLPIYAGTALLLPTHMWGPGTVPASAQTLSMPVPGGTLIPTTITKYVQPLVIPPAMPRTSKIPMPMGKAIDYYAIAVRQFRQQVRAALTVSPALVVDLASAYDQDDLACLSWPAAERAAVLARLDHGSERHPEVGRHRPIDQELARADFFDLAEALAIDTDDIQTQSDLLQARAARLQNLTLTRRVLGLIHVHQLYCAPSSPSR
jgi:hypothetical protein